MKILHIIPTLHGGGAEKFCIDLCNELSLMHDVTICSLFPIEENMFMAKAIDPKIKLITLNKQKGLSINIFFKLLFLIKRNKYTVVNTHLRALTYIDLSIIFSSTKFFHTVHNLADKETDRLNRLHYKFLFSQLKVKPIGISKVVTQSIQSTYSKHFNLLIDNGVKKPQISTEFSNVSAEIQRYKTTENTIVFLTIGRITNQKNQRMLIQVFNQLKDEGNDIILLIIGDDQTPNKSLLKELQALANSHIHFLGMKPNIADYMCLSSGFCLSSVYEGLPLTLLEAMSLGTLPICTPAGGIPDVLIHNYNGLLSTDFTSASYYNAIKQYLDSDPQQVQRMRQQALDDFEQSYNMSSTAKKYLNLYQS